MLRFRLLFIGFLVLIYSSGVFVSCASPRQILIATDNATDGVANSGLYKDDKILRNETVLSLIEAQHHFNRTAALIHQKNAKDLTTFLIVMIFAFIFLILVCGILEQENGKFCGFRHVCCCFGHLKSNTNEYSPLSDHNNKTTHVDSESCDVKSNSSTSELPSCCVSGLEGIDENKFDYGSFNDVEPAVSRTLNTNFSAIKTNNSDLD